MDNNKNFSDGMLKEYISSEIENIKTLRSDPKNWKRNTQFHDQVTIRMDGESDVSKISNGEL